MNQNWVRVAHDKFLASFARNPVAWILLGLLLVAEWGNYQNGRDLRRVCDLVAPHIMTVPDRYATTVEQKVDNICLRREG